MQTRTVQSHIISLLYIPLGLGYDGEELVHTTYLVEKQERFKAVLNCLHQRWCEKPAITETDIMQQLFR